MPFTIDVHHHILPDFFWRETNARFQKLSGKRFCTGMLSGCCRASAACLPLETRWEEIVARRGGDTGGSTMSVNTSEQNLNERVMRINLGPLSILRR
jgi:hypothetical protein